MKIDKQNLVNSLLKVGAILLYTASAGFILHDIIKGQTDKDIEKLNKRIDSLEKSKKIKDMKPKKKKIHGFFSFARNIFISYNGGYLKMKSITKQTLEEVEKEYSEREKELIDFLVKHYEEMSDDNIRATINLIDTGRMVVDARRMYEKIIKRGF